MNRRRLLFGIACAWGMGFAIFAKAEAKAEAKVERYAIVVGHNQAAEAGRADLKFADDDAIRAHLLFLQAGVESRLLVSKDAESQRAFPGVQAFGPPTRAHLQKAFAEVEAALRGKVGAELIFFFSGHGNVERGEGYLVLQGGRLSRSDFAALLGASSASQRHILIDACKSYFMAYEKGPGGERRAYDKPFVNFFESGDSQRNGFILSTSTERQSHEWERYQSGVFSHELMSGLRGGADVDGDGRINYSEIGAFLDTANKGIENLRLRPLYFVRPPGRFPGDLGQNLLEWPDKAAGFRVDVGELGHAYVEDARGQRILDLHPVGTAPVLLHLPRSRPLFFRQVKGEREWVIADQRALSEAQAQPLAALRDKGALEQALDRLFVLPFGAVEVRQYSEDFLRVGQWTLSLMQSRLHAQDRQALRLESRSASGASPWSVAKWSGLGLSLATGTAAVFLGVLADRDAAAAREEIYGSSVWQDKADMADREGLAANVLAGTAGALALGTLVLFLVDGFAGGDEGAVGLRATAGGGALGMSF